MPCPAARVGVPASSAARRDLRPGFSFLPSIVERGRKGLGSNAVPLRFGRAVYRARRPLPPPGSSYPNGDPAWKASRSRMVAA